ncbi:hypothetical protein NUW58_g6176 [Xylaria curta]|uniref:Uncharacterized protein n=1 Tax=Xylaria curta TaxID=42375 RepID=A0ACC1NZZ4_9PEZI|nr:hypothetical protein NUW58_g6176 [Xylaria curta]
MPIGDLLAEISGGQPSSVPSPTKPAAPSGIKRKAEDGSNGTTSTKLTKARQPDGSYSTSKVTRDREGRIVERSYSVSRPVKAASPGQAASASMHSSTLPHRTSSPSKNGRYEPPTPTSQRTASTSNKMHASSTNPTQPKRPLEASSRPKLNPSTSTTKAAPSKARSTTPTTSNPSQAPKKGSFKDIMARAAKAQEVMGKVGMIQHKSTDKATVKKERESSKPEQKAGIGFGAKGKTGTSYTGTGRPSALTGRDSGPGASARAVSRNGPTKEVKTTSKLKSALPANDAPEKKVKKSVTATTGYAGTARPRPGATANKGPSSSGDQRPRHGGLLEPPRMRHRSKYEEEYDEDLDDFIDYDDEEEQDTGPRYYDSDGSSDMEAGMSDIDVEERRAELYAREEDRREQALEEKLKREKEERKRRLGR